MGFRSNRIAEDGTPAARGSRIAPVSRSNGRHISPGATRRREPISIRIARGHRPLSRIDCTTIHQFRRAPRRIVGQALSLRRPPRPPLPPTVCGLPQGGADLQVGGPSGPGRGRGGSRPQHWSPAPRTETKWHWQLGVYWLKLGLKLEILDHIASARNPVRLSTACLLVAGIAGAGSFLLLRGFGSQQLPNHLAAITVDYPAEGSVFPPEITPPTFLWRDTAANATSWAIDITFPDHARGIRVKAAADRMRIGEIDPEAVSRNNEPPKLTPEQAAARTWTPDAETWAAIKRRSVESPATIVITGFRDEDMKQPVSSGQVRIQTSRDPAGAPIFYRDVPLMPNTARRRGCPPAWRRFARGPWGFPE